jgi:hypothetical protein
MDTNSTPIQLPAPTLPAPWIPVVEQSNKGGLGVEELRKNPPEPVDVTSLIDLGILPGATMTLFWNDLAVDSYVISRPQIETGVLSFKVQPSEIVDGEDIVVFYTSITAEGVNLTVSHPYTVRVNTKVPGTPPLNSPEPINQNLEAPRNIPTPITDAIAAQGIDVVISPWTNMEVGDVLTLTWGQNKIVMPALNAGDLQRPVIVHVSSDIILSTSQTLGLKVFYDIRDNVGNWSLNSLPAKTDVEAGVSDLFAPRVVKAAGDNDLALGDLGTADAEVQIPAYSPWSIGDRVDLYWLGLTAGGIEVNATDVYFMRNGDQGFTVTMNIPNAPVVAIAGGSAMVYYEVNGARRSARTHITVSGAIQKLPAPEILQAPGTELDPVSVPPTGASVLVKWSPGMALGDQVYVYWNGTTAAGGGTSFTTNMEVTVLGQDLLFTVPKDQQVVPLAGGTLDLYYVVVPAVGGAQRESEHRTWTVKGAVGQQPPALDILEDNDATHVLDIAGLTKVTARVPDYGMVTGDTVVVGWAGVTQRDTSPRTVTAAGPLDFDIPLAWATENVDRPAGVTVTYSYGRGANPVVISLPLHISVTERQGALDLVEPRVVQAINKELDFTWLPDGIATVEVFYQGMAVGHTVRVRWRGRIEYFTETQEVKTIGPLRFDIPRDEVIDVIGSTVDVNYSVVVTPGAPILPSKIYELIMRRQPLNLVAPTINGDYTNVRVDYPGSLTSHTIVVRWVGVTEHSTGIKHPEQNGYYVNFTIPSSWVTENRGRTLKVNYSVGVGNNPLIFSQLLRVSL